MLSEANMNNPTGTLDAFVQYYSSLLTKQHCLRWGGGEAYTQSAMTDKCQETEIQKKIGVPKYFLQAL